MTTLKTTDYAKLGAAELAGLVRKGEVKLVDAVCAAADVLEQRNPGLRAVVAADVDDAIRQAEEALPGPLAGVPILLKDLGAPSIGTRSTFGSALFADAHLWSHDCVAVSRLKQAGAVVLGRSASGEFGICLSTETDRYGATENPWKPGHSAGGSSGGSAAAVAAGIVPLAHGTDGCGSLRVPASHCGLFAIKPSRAVIPFAPDMGESWAGMSTMGPLARTVEDAALFLDAVAGPDPGDPYFAHPQTGEFHAGFRHEPARLRVGVVTEAPNGFLVDSECIDAVTRAASLLHALGHDVEPTVLPIDYAEALPHLRRIWAAQLWALVERRYRALGRKPDGSGMEKLSWALAQTALADISIDYWAAIQFLHGTCRVFSAHLDKFDILLSPVAANPPEQHGWMRAHGDDVAGYLGELFRRFPFTAPFNITGRPAISAPMHVTAGGLPVGVQFAGRMGDDLTLLRLGRQLEAAGAFRLPA